MYHDGLLCVPLSLTVSIIRAHHAEAVQPGADRLWSQMGRWYAFADPTGAKRLTKGMQKSCEVCQACDPSRAPYKCFLEATPVPPYLMDSVAVDLFAMPEVTFEGTVYVTMQLCVDRQSGWFGLVE